MNYYVKRTVVDILRVAGDLGSRMSISLTAERFKQKVTTHKIVGRLRIGVGWLP